MSHRKKGISLSDYNHHPHQAKQQHYCNPYDTSWVDNLVEVDFLIKEYLIFRGYHKTWEQFYRERKRDQTKNKNIGGYQVDLIVDQLIGYIRNLKLNEYLDFWNTLNLRIFNKLPPQYRESIYHLDTALKRYYLITARKRNSVSSIQAFFNKFGDELISRPDANDWMKWFVLPHIKHPEKHLEFESYFNKNWSYSVQISLKNFLSTALCRFPRPKILAFMILKQEREEFKATIAKLKEKLNDADFIIRSLHQQLTALTVSNSKRDIDDDEYETNKLINKAIHQYQSDSPSVHASHHIIKTQNTQNTSKTRHNRAQSAINVNDMINEKYFRTGTSPSPQIQALKHAHVHPHPTMLKHAYSENRHRKTLPEDAENDNTDDVKAFNDNILFNARPLTPTRSLGSKNSLFKWFRGKSQDIEEMPPKLVQTPEVLTPIDKKGLHLDENSAYDVELEVPSISSLPGLLQSQISSAKKDISMKTIFVPGVAINSVCFNENGRCLAYSTQAGVIQVYQFGGHDDKEGAHAKESKENKELSPSLLHTFCVSKPNEILQLLWDPIDCARLFIAIGNGSSHPNKKHDDHIQIWNVWDKKCEYIISISFGAQCPWIECIKCDDTNRLIVCGKNKNKNSSQLYLYGDEHDDNEWSLLSTSSQLSDEIITCVEFNHNGKIIYVGGTSGYIRIFDIQSRFTELTSWCAHYGSIQSIHLCNDANSIISIATDFIVKHWNLLNNYSLKKVWKIVNECDNKTDADSDSHGDNLDNIEDKDDDCDGEPLPLLCLGPNDYFAVTQSQQSHTENNDIFNVIIKCIANNKKNNVNEIIVGGHSKIITAIDWHKQSKLLATCSLDGTLRIFQIFGNQ